MDLINLDILRIGRRWNLSPLQATPELEVVAESSLAGDGTGQASAPRIQETPEIEQIVRFFRGGDSTGQAGAPRIQETPEIEQIARLFRSGDSAEQASALPIQETPEIEQIARLFCSGDSAEQASALRIQETPEIEQIARLFCSGDSAEQASAPPIQETLKIEELAPFFLVGDSAEQASAAAIQETLKIEELAPFFLAGDRAEQASAAPIHETPEVEAIAPSPIAGDTGEQTSLPVIQGRPLLKKASQPFVVRHAEEEPLQPSLLSFYGLCEQPFGVTPDPAYLYFSPAHHEALRSISRGIQDDRGFMALIAEPGMGKTTLLNKLLEEVRDSSRTVFLFQTQCDSRGFFRYLLSELGVESLVGMDLVAMHNKLNEILFQEMLEGRRFVLVVDEAQNLHDSVLETIRLLSDFETSHTKLLEIVLAGQPQLAAKLARPNLSQLRQRIAVLAKLEPLSAAETARYIEHRLRVAGYTGGFLFAPDALALIAERSQGIPRNINNICFSALMLGHSRGRKTIGSDIVQEVVAKLDLESLVQRPKQPRAAIKPARVAAADNPPSTGARSVPAPHEPTHPLLTTLPDQGQPEQGCFKAAKSTGRVTLSGKVNELVACRNFGKKREFRMQATLGREASSEILVADRYYCCNFYADEDDIAAFQPGQSIRITIEAD